jgi:REP element-mobilizing transposase RayT
MTTNEYIRGVRNHGWPAFRGRLWQRNYYEQIIRDEDSLNRVRAYVSANPARWLTDRDNQNPIHGTERRPND